MPYYYGKWSGSGTRLDPFKPEGVVGADWSVIDLRPDGGASLSGAGLNALLLHSDTPQTSPSLVLIADTPDDRIKNLSLNRLASALGLSTFTATTMREALAELMMDPQPLNWPQAQTREGKRVAQLGPLRVER